MSILKKRDNNSQHWLSISDLMSGLMILFIFIAIGFMRIAFVEKERANTELQKFKEIEALYGELFAKNQGLEDILTKYKDLVSEKLELENKLHQLQEIYASREEIFLENQRRLTGEIQQIRGIAETYKNNQIAIHQALMQAFPAWILAENQLNAEIDGNTLTFIFKSSDSLFDNASANLKEQYKTALKKFFPKYIEAILPYKSSISEIRIEGHTSSEWSYFPNHIKHQSQEIKKLYGYFENMKLSQARTNSVLNYVLMDLNSSIPEEHHKWIRDHTAAVGLSSSKPILDMTGNEDPNRSRRVTFRIITNADHQIQRILQQK